MYPIENLRHSDSNNFFLLAGPCVIENEELPFQIAEQIKTITDKLKIPFIFKASYKKANRSKIDSFTGLGDEKGMEILHQIKNKYQIPVITDVHSPWEATEAGKFVDVLQIPAFLCRQTELLVSAAKTNKVVNIKKGQFLSPSAIKFAAQKVVDSGNNKVWITERGTTFGYQDLIVDMRSFPVIHKFDLPVILDITHSLQQPNQASGVTGGQPEMIETIGRAGIAAGADGLFIETHPEPSNAKSDGANMLNLDDLEKLLTNLTELRATVNKIDNK